MRKLKNCHCQIAVEIMKEDHLDRGSVSSAVEVLLLTAIILMKVMKRTLMSILEMIVCLTNMIEIRVTFVILNLLGPFLFLFDFLEI